MMIRTRKIPATDTTGAMIEALEVGGTHSSRTAYDYAAVDPFRDAAQRLAGNGWDVERRDQSGSGRVYQFFVGTPKPKPTTPEPDTRYLDTVTREGYCPGFRLWDVVADDGVTYRMAGDNAGGVDVRLFFRTNGAVKPVSITLIGDNPGVQEWEALRTD